MKNVKIVHYIIGQLFLSSVLALSAFASGDNMLNLGGSASTKEWTSTDLILAIVLGAAIISFIGYKIYKKVKKRKAPPHMAHIPVGPPPDEITFTAPSKANTATLSESEIIDAIKDKYPDFPVSEIKNYANEVYKKVENAWTTKTPLSIRAYETDSLFEKHENVIRGYIYDKRTNHHDVCAIQSTLITAFDEEEDKLRIKIRLIAILKDYTIDDRTEELVLGNREEKLRRIFKLEFIISKNFKDRDKIFDLSDTCPICGNPLIVNNSGECDHCKKIISTDDYKFLLDSWSSEETF